MKMRNAVAEALTQRDQAIGTWVQSYNPDACEIAGACGFDFVIIDLEHGQIGWDGMVEMIRAVECTPASSIVRLPDALPTSIGKALDGGALGVLIPNIRTGPDAEQAVRAARFPPVGMRGACPMIRATDFQIVDWADYSRWSDANSQVWVNIETVEAVENIEDILAAGVDAIILGIFDLSMNMGLNGQHDHPRVRAALEQVLAAAQRRGVDAIAVCFETEPEAIVQFCSPWRERGCRMFTGLMDRTYLRLAYQKVVAGFRASET